MTYRPRILVVDDEPEMCQALGQQLSDADYAVECLYDASSAYIRLSTDPYDLVLTDLMMPDMSGLDLLRLIRKANNDVPVIILTGHESLGTAIAATHLRVSDYLIKSMLSRQELLDTVERVLNEPPPE